MGRWQRGLLLGGTVAGLGVMLVGLRLDARVRAYLAGPALGGIRIYAAPTILRAGDPVPGGSLTRKLTRLGYQVAANAQQMVSGEFHSAGTATEIVQRAPGGTPARRVRVGVRGGHVTEIVVGGASLAQLELEPEMLAVISGGAPALGATVEVTPAACRAAVIAAEDRNFFVHHGVDPRAIARALLANVRAHAPRQGASTLTQQVVKNAFLSPRRTLARKLEEALLALLLEARASKEEIVSRYLASVYLGVDGGLPIHGFAEAAAVYFGKPVGDLDAAECALLAGIIRSPNRLSPRNHAAAAVARRNQVLALMESNGLLTRAAGAEAMSAPLKLAPPRARPVAALYVAAEVARELPQILPRAVAQAPGLNVYTAIDADAQRQAERAARRGLAALERRQQHRPLQAALVALDPSTGQVRALVGGRDYGSSPLDRAMRTRRQPGSTFKPFVYLAALDPGRHREGQRWTVVSPLEDTPLAVRVGNAEWKPDNYDRRFEGRISVADAIAQSRNAATVRLALDVGIDAVARAAEDLGIAAPLPRVPALALGVAETSLLELTAAYGVFASGGVRRPPALVVAVTSHSGDTLYAAHPQEQHVLDPGVAYLVTHLLEGVIDRGTGTPAREAGMTGPAAGKTGTTDDTRDAWFVGFTPDMVAGVWVGFDDGEPTGLTGAQAALPIWVDFMRATTGQRPRADFPVPDNIVWRDVDPASGKLATAACPMSRRDPFLVGTEPLESCPLHRGIKTAAHRHKGVLPKIGDAIGGWFSRLFH